jgi:hypothetical protein
MRKPLFLVFIIEPIIYIFNSQIEMFSQDNASNGWCDIHKGRILAFD